MIKKLPKILLIIFLSLFILQMLIFLFLWLSPLLVKAAEPERNPAYDPGCWREAMCRTFTECEAPLPCWEKDPACGGSESEWGRCYPKTAPIKLQIKLQGAEEVVDIADYIAKLYTYTVSVGGILATVMIIFGGIIYLTAGGNPSRITQAKEYISNALIGSVLLFTSYLLLQTINPDLVKLSMPRVYLIRPRSLLTQFCNELYPISTILNTSLPPTERRAAVDYLRQNPLKFAKADKPFDEIQETDYNIIVSEVEDLKKLSCAQKFYEYTAGEQSCIGSGCAEPNKDCVIAGGSPGNESWSCQEVAIWGKYTCSSPKIDNVTILAMDEDDVISQENLDNAEIFFDSYYVIKKTGPLSFLGRAQKGWAPVFEFNEGYVSGVMGGASLLDWSDPECPVGPENCKIVPLLSFYAGDAAISGTNFSRLKGDVLLWNKDVLNFYPLFSKPPVRCDFNCNDICNIGSGD